MSTDPTGLSPDAAFALVADETRLEILRTLSGTEEPLAFSTLFERSEYETRSNFSYHLDKLEGHFIAKTESGYALRQAGRRVVEAIISGTMTEEPRVERAPVDEPCPFCGSSIEISYEQERVKMFCPACPGVGDQDEPREELATEPATLGHIALPPSGVQGRTPEELFRAAQAWDNLDLLGDSAGVCARCAGTVEHSVTVCADHDVSGEVCERCGRRHAVLFEVDCVSCPNSKSGIAIVCLLASTELLSFVTDHGANPLIPETYEVAPGALADYEEEVRSVDPFRGTFTFTVEDERLTLTVDEHVSIVDAERKRVSAPAQSS